MLLKSKVGREAPHSVPSVEWDVERKVPKEAEVSMEDDLFMLIHRVSQVHDVPSCREAYRPDVCASTLSGDLVERCPIATVSNPLDLGVSALSYVSQV